VRRVRGAGPERHGPQPNRLEPEGAARVKGLIALVVAGFVVVMERIYYAGDRFETGTELARALVDYAAALARHGSAANVEIPVRHADGTQGTVNFLIGPASQIVTETLDDEQGDEVLDAELVARLRALTAELSPMHPVARPAALEPEGTSGYDWTDEV